MLEQCGQKITYRNPVLGNGMKFVVSTGDDEESKITFQYFSHNIDLELSKLNDYINTLLDIRADLIDRGLMKRT